MVSWYADGDLSGYDAATGLLKADRFKLAVNGSTDLQGITRLGQAVPSSVQNRLNAVARLRINGVDIAGAAAAGRRVSATMYTVANRWGTSTPTNAQIRAAAITYGSVRRSTKTLPNELVEADIEFPITGLLGTDLAMGTKYWVLVLPTAVKVGTPATQDIPIPPVNNPVDVPSLANSLGRSVSVWTKRQALAPTITAPATGITVDAGEIIPLSFEARDPDAIVGGTPGSATEYYYSSLGGVQVQYAPQPTPSNPSPVWQDLPFGNISGTAMGRGWYIHKDPFLATPHTQHGAYWFWLQRSSGIRGGGTTPTSGYGRLPSGSWQIRVRTFSYGHPYPSLFTPLGSGGSFIPDNLPTRVRSPWSTPVAVTINSQVPPPIPLSPVSGNAVVTGQPVVVSWRYRNTHVPPFPQASRIVEYRAVGATNWTSSTSLSSAQSMQIATTLPVGEYEWRVRVSDTDGVLSDWSSVERFWVVPVPASGDRLPFPSDTVDAATLGRGAHRVFVYRRGGKIRTGELRNLSHIEWNRLRDDISTARVVVSDWDVDGGNMLAALRTWAYEIVIFRDNGYSQERVWEGPITLLRFEENAVTISARDVMVHAYRRVIRQKMSDSGRGATVVSRAARVLQNAFAPDDPNVLAYLTPMMNENDAMQYRSIPEYSRTAFEEVDDMASNAGLDYTVVGRSIILWGTKNRIGTLPEFQDADLGSPPIVSEYGMSFANRYIVSDGNGVYGIADRLNSFGGDGVYGLVELLSSSWASDSTEDTGTYTQEGLAKIKSSFEGFAERSISSRNPPPIVVRVPDNTTLNPDTVLSIQHLVPGVVIPLRSTGTLRPVVADQKLDAVKVVETAGSETISITLSPFNQDDTEQGEGDVE